MKNNRNKSPKTAYWLICKIFGKEDHPTLIGDFEEIFTEIAKEKGLFAASVWYWSQIVKALPAFIKNQVYWRMTMFRNYFKIVIRNMSRYKGFSFIKIIGLSVGMTCCILILLWVKDELSYDRYHNDAHRIYRVALELHTKDSTRLTAQVACHLGPLLKKVLPQVEDMVRFLRWGSWLVKYGNDKVFYENRFYYVDPEVFDVFKIPFIKGNPKTALTLPSTLVITRDMARKYFGREEPLGKSLNINNEDYKITGVIENIPHNTHLKFDFLTSVKPIDGKGTFQYWGTLAFYTYIKVAKNSSIEQLENQLKEIPDKYIPKPPKNTGIRNNFFLQPLVNIHLHSHLNHETEVPGSLLYIYIFSAIAIFILILACINFVSLSTAQSVNRAKEVGLRKVVGAQRSQLVMQFLGESITLSGIALVVAFIIIKLALPLFNELVGQSLSFDFFTDMFLLLMVLGIWVFVGVVAGVYPAFFLSSFRSVLAFKGTLASGSKGVTLRKALVLCQFTISIVLIIGSLVVHQQLDFMKNRDLGFDKEEILVLPVRGSQAIKENYEPIKNEFTQHQGVLAASVSSSVPGLPPTSLETSLADQEDDKRQVMLHFFVDHDFIDLYKIDIVLGRDFQREFTTDIGDAFIINETAVKAFGWNSPREAMGKRLFVSGLYKKEGVVIGVTKDFHYRSLHSVIEPVVFKIVPIRFSHLSLKIKTVHLTETLSLIENQWKKIFPDKPFEYFFLDEEFSKQYQGSEKFAQIFGIFTILGIVVACLGLFGLASCITERRTKEIGIRKVLGASVSRIVFLLSKEFTIYVVIANIAAWPIGYYLMNQWIQGFAYRININHHLWIFIVAGILALLVAQLTVSFKVVRTAVVNPVETLRYE